MEESILDRLLLIGFAGALGAVSRYAVQGWVNDLIGRPSVLGTLIVNVSGAFVLGLFLTISEERFLTSGYWRSAVAVGFLGAYTTFSTLMFESMDRLEAGDTLAALANIMGSVIIGLLAVYAGIVTARAI